MTNLELFIQTYKTNLAACLEKYPDDYAWPVSELDSVLDRMKIAIIKGNFSKDSSAFKMTCKQLGINHTYKAIAEFINSQPDNTLKCCMTDDCTCPVTHIDDKGFIYCHQHGINRKAYRPCRQLSMTELDQLKSGQTIGGY